MTRKHLVLLGDSVFDNHAYVAQGRALSTIWAGCCHQRDDRVSLLAVDGDVSQNIPGQLQKLPSDVTHLAMSVGGNDALGCLPALDASCSSVLEALSRLNELQRQFANSYRLAVSAVARWDSPVWFAPSTTGCQD